MHFSKEIKLCNFYTCAKTRKITSIILFMFVGIQTSYLLCNSVNSIDQAIQTDQKKTTLTEEADMLISKAKHNFLSSPELSLEQGLKALSLYDQVENLEGKANSLNIIGACLSSLGQYEKALNRYQQALSINQGLNNEVNQGKNLTNIGNIYLKNNDYEKALENYFDALNLFEKDGYNKHLIAINNNIGLIYKNTGNLEKALNHYKKGLKSSVKLNDKNQESAILYNISTIFLEQHELKKAIEACETSLLIRKELRNTSGIIKNLTALGRMTYQVDEYDQSTNYLTEGLELANQLNIVEEKAVILQHLGYNSIRNNESDNAREYMLQSLEIATEFNLHNLIYSNYQYLAQIDSISGDFESALAYQQKYFLLKPAIKTFSVDAKLNELQKKYDYTRKQQIATTRTLSRSRTTNSYLICLFVFIVLVGFLIIQHYKIKTQKEINELTQQNLRSQINPHFIFNVLNSIQYYILRNDSEASSKYLTKFASLLRLTLDNSQTNLVPINDEIESLKLYLELESMRLENNLEYLIELDNDIDSYMFKIPTLLLQPFVENSIIHGIQEKNGKGKVHIKLQLKNNAIHCLIEDNGVGRKKADILKTEEQKQRKSHGRHITETRLNLLNSIYGKELGIEYSDLTNEQKEPCGTRVEFDLPIMN